MSQYSSSSLRCSRSARRWFGGDVQLHENGTHRVEALDVANVFVYEQLHFGGHATDACATRTGYQRHCAAMSGIDFEVEGVERGYLVSTSAVRRRPLQEGGSAWRRHCTMKLALATAQVADADGCSVWSWIRLRWCPRTALHWQLHSAGPCGGQRTGHSTLESSAAAQQRPDALVGQQGCAQPLVKFAAFASS